MTPTFDQKKSKFDMGDGYVAQQDSNNSSKINIFENGVWCESWMRNTGAIDSLTRAYPGLGRWIENLPDTVDND